MANIVIKPSRGEENNRHIGWKATSTTGVVAADGADAIAAGIAILDSGGNAADAADAAVATIFALNVTDHGPCSIGGEVPLIIYDAKTQQVKALSGQGRAPLSQDAIDWYMENGISGDLDIKIAPVPSVVDLCITTLRQYGTRTFADVITPTLALLDQAKQPWHAKLAVTLRRMVEEEQLTTGTREEKLQSACDRFYGRNKHRNDIADDLEANYIAKGGFLRKSDLTAHKTTIEEPISIDYRGYTIYKCDPWTQGQVLCQASCWKVLTSKQWGDCQPTTYTWLSRHSNWHLPTVMSITAILILSTFRWKLCSQMSIPKCAAS